MWYIASHMPASSSNNLYLCVMDFLEHFNTNLALFLPYSRDYRFDKMTSMYVQKILKYHGVSMSIFSDKDPRSPQDFEGFFRKC